MGIFILEGKVRNKLGFKCWLTLFTIKKKSPRGKPIQKKLLLFQAFLCTLVDQGVHLFFSFPTNIFSNKVKK